MIRGGSEGGQGGRGPFSEIYGPPVAHHLRKFSSLDAFVDEFDARHQNRKLALH